MKVLNFTLMPYRAMDVPASKAHRSAWVVLPNTFYDPEKGAHDYESYIDLLAQSEPLGFDGVCVNEHHQTAYGLMPAPNLIASALIQRTKTIKIAVLGRALPLVNNPINIAEEFAMLDNMSRGRMIAGFVRGIGAEYHSTTVNPFYSHERFHEAHDLIVKAWTQPGPFAWEGEHFNLNYVNLWPRVYQQPHPPIWIPSQGSIETIEWAADPSRKYPFLVTFSAREAVIKNLLAYKDQTQKYGYEAQSSQLGWAAPVYVADTVEKAMQESREAIEALFNDYLTLPMEMLLPPGYTSIESLKKIIATKKAIGRGGFGGPNQRQTLERLMELGTVLVGTPETILNQIEQVKEKTNLGNFVSMLQFGTLSNELTQRNQARFASDIMPKLQKMV
jgi:alkanesulfonate monooxygenase SsuD/methylene tetrahydromethanopterin reductase-like flavin-dependent oxidoreductase (luciferase family)